MVKSNKVEQCPVKSNRVKKGHRSTQKVKIRHRLNEQVEIEHMIHKSTTSARVEHIILITKNGISKTNSKVHIEKKNFETF